MYQAIYLFFLGLAFMLSIISRTKKNGFHIISILLGAGILTECVFKTGVFLGYNGFPVYNIYVQVEFVLLLWYYYTINNFGKIRWLFLLFALLYVLTKSTLLLLYPDQWMMPPRLFYNISCGVNIGLAAYTLIQIEPSIEQPIHKTPTFWFCSGFILFYTAVFVFNGLAIFLNKEDYEWVQKIIVKVANIWLYLSISYGFICQRTLKTSF